MAWALGSHPRPFDLGPSLRHPDWTVNEIIAAGFPVSMLVTCMDQVAAGGRYRADGTWNCDIERLPLHVAEARRFHAVYRSTGPTRRHVAVVRSSGGMAGRRPARHQDGGNAIRGVGPR